MFLFIFLIRQAVEQKGREREKKRGWPAERQLVGGGWLRLRTSHCAFGVAITIVARCPRLDCNCSCHSSIFVSLCSVRLKDCNIYLHLFSAAAPAAACCLLFSGLLLQGRHGQWVTVTAASLALVCFALATSNNNKKCHALEHNAF